MVSRANNTSIDLDFPAISTPFDVSTSGDDSYLLNLFNTRPAWTGSTNAPPGFHMGGGQAGSFDHPFAPGIEDEAPVMPGLGNVPPATDPSAGQRDENVPFGRVSEIPTGPSKGREAQQSTFAKQATGKKPSGPQVTPQNNEESFPALPKASAPPPAPPAAHASVAAKKPKDKAKKEPPAPRAASNEASKVTDLTSAQSERQQAQDTNAKAKQPGKLDIAAATSKESNQEQSAESKPSSSKPETPARSAKDTSASPSTISRSGTPGLPLDTPSKRAARTIRVTGGTKSEATGSRPSTATPPSAQVSNSKPPAPTGPKPASQQASRQPSVTSITIPETIATEKQSEVASVTTESGSRANSPPPASRVGSAPVREKSKSKQKKERAQRAKNLVEETVSAEPEAAEPTADAVAHEPIVVRKRKSKKPTPSPAETPTAKTPAEDTKQAEPKAMEPIPEKKPEAAPVPKRSETKKAEPKKAELPKPEAPKPEPAAAAKPTPSPVVSAPTKEPSKPTSLLTTILNHLQSAGELTPATNKLLKSSPPPTCRGEINTADLTFPPSYAPLTEAEVSQLNAQRPVRRNGRSTDPNRDKSQPPAPASSRLLITPHSRLCIRALPPDLEDRILDLEQRLHATPPHAKFHPPSIRDTTGGPAKYGGRKTAGTTRRVSSLIRELTCAYAEVEAQTAGAAAVAAAAATEALRKSDERKARIAAGEVVHDSPARTPLSPPPGYADDALAYLNQFILPQPPPPPPAPAQAPALIATNQPTSTETHAHTPTDQNQPQEPFPTASGPPTNPNQADDIGTAIPRTYTTGDPTFSVSGVDISGHGFYAARHAAVYRANAAAEEEEGERADEDSMGHAVYESVDERGVGGPDEGAAAEGNVQMDPRDPYRVHDSASRHTRVLASGRESDEDDENAEEEEQGDESESDEDAAYRPGTHAHLRASIDDPSKDRLDRYEAIKAMHARELEDALEGARREAREMERKLGVLMGGVGG